MMSGIDDNIFVDNPFAEPSHQTATRSSTTRPQQTLYDTTSKEVYKQQTDLDASNSSVITQISVVQIIPGFSDPADNKTLADPLIEAGTRSGTTRPQQTLDSSDPFSKEQTNTPFADLLIEVATRSGTTRPQQTLDSCDPFSKYANEMRKFKKIGQPATLHLHPSTQIVPTYIQSSAQYNHNTAPGSSSPTVMTRISAAELQILPDTLNNVDQPVTLPLQPSTQTIQITSQSGAQYKENTASSVISPLVMTEISTAEQQVRHLMSIDHNIRGLAEPLPELATVMDRSGEQQLSPTMRHSVVQDECQQMQLDDQALDLSFRRSESKPPITSPNQIIQTVPDTSSMKPLKPKIKPYAESTLKNALDKIRETAMPFYAASKVYGIPRTTLQYRLSTGYKNKGSRGPYTVFSTKEERDIVTWLHDMERKGFPITQNSLRYKISCFLKANPRQTPFKDNTPGKSWFKLFMKRHPELSIRIPEGVTAASSKVTEKDIRNWFRGVYSYLEDNKLTDVLDDPARILNGDETGFSLNPIPKQVIGMKGKKDIAFIETTNSKHNITVMFSFAANGNVIPPDVILNQKRPSREILRAFPGNWGIGTSENGWMNTTNFVAYIKKILYPALVKGGTKFPVLYFVDGHSSHIAFEAADACKQLDIIMIALYPNATRILQPADVAIFRPLKNSWGKIVDVWRSDHPSEKMTLITFGPLLEKAMEMAFKKSTIINGFAVCGLHPFNANAVDYAKCLGKSAANDVKGSNDGLGGISTLDETEGDPTTATVTNDTGAASVGCVIDEPATLPKNIAVSEDVLRTATRMLGSSKINLYLSEEADLSHEDKVLSYIYKNILVLGEPSTNDDLLQAAVCTSHVEEPYYFDPDIYLDDFNDGADPVFENDQNIREAAHVSGVEYTFETIADNDMMLEAIKTPLQDSTNLTGISDYLISPSTPKRNPKHRNYINRTNVILTAAERLEDLRISEEKKKESLELKKKRAEMRENRKKEKEKLAATREENKIERERAKQEATQQKIENALKRKLEKEKKQAEKNIKKRKISNIVI